MQVIFVPVERVLIASHADEFSFVGTFDFIDRFSTYEVSHSQIVWRHSHFFLHDIFRLGDSY